MIATQVTVYRAASIALVLAASAFVCAPARVRSAASRTPEPSVHAETSTELDLSFAMSAPQEQAPRPRGGHWQGTCRAGEHGWPAMPVTLALTVDDQGSVDATGTLAFIGRRTRATLHGGVLYDRFILHGEMKEVGGLGTIWRIEVNGRFKGPDRIVGRFVEVYTSERGNGALMCTFDWQR